MAANATFEYGLIKASEVKERAQERGENDFNVFGALNQYALKSISEVLHSDFIAYLLNPNAKHNQKLFLKEFLAKLQKENLFSEFFEKLKFDEFDYVEREQATRNISKNRRVDIALRFNDKFIVIENKITAGDQDLQVKDYITNALKMDGEKTIKPQNILFIYLHPDGDETPSDDSLGDWNIKGNEIQNKSGEMQSYYFKMDYFWIREWLEVCVYRLCKEQRECGKSGFGKIIFGVEQYIELLTNEPEILDEREESNAVLEFIMQNEEYQKMALAIMRNEEYQNEALKIMRNDEQKFDKNLREIVENSWGTICERVVQNFYEKLLKPFESEKGARVGKYTWKAYRTDDELGKTGWQIVFYKKERGLNLDYVMAFAFVASNFRKSYFAYGCPYYYAEGYEKLVAGCEKFFTPKNKGVRKDEDCYYKYIFDEKDSKEYAFAEWIIDKGESAVDEFKAKFAEFIELDTIKEVMSKVEKYIDNELKNSK